MKRRIVPVLALLSLLAGLYGVGPGLAQKDESQSQGPAPVEAPSSSPGPAASTAYRLMAWSELGMHCIDGKDYSVMSVLPPYNIIRAQLMTLANPPIPVTGGVTITYQAVADSSGSINTISSTKTNFWSPNSGKIAYNFLLFPNTITGTIPGEPVITLVNPPKDEGLTGNWVQSVTPPPNPHIVTPNPLTYNSTWGYWEATGVPSLPYDDTFPATTSFKPFPMVQLTAQDKSGNVLGTAKIVLSVSDELNCSKCHASNTDPYAIPKNGWVNDPNPSRDTRLNVLRKHDDLHDISSYLPQLAAKGYNYQSTLEATARGGTPVLCAACHASNALAETGLTGINPLTQDMHAKHGPQIDWPASTTQTLDQVASNSTNFANLVQPCYLCHPGPKTQCLRGAMSPNPSQHFSGIACSACHGNLAGTVPGTNGTYVGQAGRAGWLTEPACQMCHQGVVASGALVGFRYTTTLTSSDLWRTSTDQHFATNQNVPLATFELYRYSKEQYSSNHGTIYCSACHGSPHSEFPTTQMNDNVYSTNLQGYKGVIRECTVCHNPVPMTPTGGPHGLHTVGQSWVDSHHDYADNPTACQYCHGANYKGTFLSQLKTTKTFNAGDFGIKTFPAGHMMNCYDCHNGPGGG